MVSAVLCAEMKLWFGAKVCSITTSLTECAVCISVGVLGCLQICVGVEQELLCAFLCASVCVKTILFQKMFKKKKNA